MATLWATRSWIASAWAPVGLHRWGLLMDAAAAALAATLCLGAQGRATNRRSRVAWRLQALANAVWVLAPLGLALQLARPIEPALLLGSRFGYLGLTAGGFVLTSRTPDPRTRVRMMLDGVTVAVSVFVVGWALVLAPMVRAGDPTAMKAVCCSMAFPVAGLTLVIFYLLLAYTEFAPGPRRMPLLFAAGLAAVSLADARFGALSLLAGRPADVVDCGGWAVGFLLVGLAARSYRGTTARRTEFVAARWLIVAPYGVLAAAAVTVAVHVEASHTLEPAEATGLAVLLVVVLARQLLLLTQNRSLVLELADRHRDLSHQALHDSLTGLGNRELLMTRMDEPLRRHSDGPPQLSLMLCDLDDFKQVNDALGHQAGDELLIQVAARLRSGVRTGDTVVRLGGDEFAILLEAAPDDALAVARGLRLAFQEPFPVSGQPLALTASIGVVHLPAAGDPPTPGQLLRSADMAMYEVKRRGKNDVQVFRADFGTAPAQPADVRAEFAAALDAGAVTVTFEPLLRLPDGRFAGAEALPRWAHPTLGTLDVPDLVAGSGRGRLVSRLTELLLSAAAGAAVAWPGSTSVHVRLTAAQLADPRLVDHVRHALTATGLDAGRLTVEVSEPIALREAEGMTSVLQEIDRLGCRVAVGGFGSGQCAIGLLAALPIGLVTLDRRLVHDLPRYRELVRAVVTFVHSRGAPVVAADVDHPQQWELAVELGCDLARGPLVGAPVRPDQISRTGHLTAP